MNPTPESDLPDAAAALASLERKLQLVRDRVTAVATGYQTGLYLFGSGGLGKSYTVLGHLDQLDVPYKLFNSRMTGKGLFRALERAPDAVHVLEDMERLTKDHHAQGVLRSALWTQPGRERVVTWTTDTCGEERFVFRGGVIMIANRPLANLPELRAMATRISVLRLDVSDAELVALMRDLAAKGFRDGEKKLLEAAECEMVVEHLLRECRATGCPLDLRLLRNSYLDYLQWEADRSACGWMDLVASRVREAASHFREGVNALSQEERRAHRRGVVRELLKQTADLEEQLRLYKERTGKSRADFFRRKNELQNREFDGEERGDAPGVDRP
jgi:hypothetical protein